MIPFTGMQMEQLRLGKILIIFLVVCLFLPLSAIGQVAQEIGFSGSPNPVGSGARALGMGGALPMPMP